MRLITHSHTSYNQLNWGITVFLLFYTTIKEGLKKKSFWTNGIPSKKKTSIIWAVNFHRDYNSVFDFLHITSIFLTLYIYIYIYKLKIKSTSIDILWNGISLYQTFQEMILPPNISRNNSPTFINVTYKLQSISHQHCISFCWEHQHCISIPSNRILCYDRKVRIYHFFCAYFIKRHLSPNVQRNDTSMVEVL